jgi:hypothetical protein
VGRDQAGKLRAAGRAAAGERAAGFGGEPGGLRDLVVHGAIVGLAGVLVLGALLLAAVAGVVTGTAQPSSPASPASPQAVSAQH